MAALQSLSLYEVLSLAVSVCGFAGVLVALFLSRRQTREAIAQSRAVAESHTGTVFANIADHMFLADEIFIRYPEVRRYFYDNEDISPSSPDWARASAVGELLLDYFVTVLLQVKRFPSVYPSSMWTEYIADVFAQSPLLCQQLQSVQGWYAGELNELMREGITRREALVRAGANLTRPN